MRSEQQMFDLILKTAKEDSRIRAVYLNGSRANPKAPKDLFQDYDVVYVVTETESFLADAGWIDRFGERLVSQQPDALDVLVGKPADFSKGYTYLMQFSDGNRIDLHLETVEEMRSVYGSDRLTLPLLDKDAVLKPLAPPSDEDYWVKRPTAGQFFFACNEFWWLCPYIAKGLWRKEILFSLDVVNSWWRPQLFQFLCWKAGLRTDFSLSVGKSGKYLKQYSDPADWQTYLSTYSAAEYHDAWEAALAGCGLFQRLALELSYAFGYDYDREEGARVTAFLEHIRTLPKDAAEI